MDHARYFIRGQVLLPADPSLQDTLGSVYQAAERPRCMCVPGGVEMYVARHAEYVIKRMPGTGHQHDMACRSFEPESHTSGIGELIGEAIVEHSPEQVEIKTAFPLTRMTGKPVPRGQPSDDPASIDTPRKRMSLRAVLHFLYDRAGFNRWYPAMDGRRSQSVICRHLTMASRGVMLKGGPLEERLFVPEQFRVSEAEEIGDRRRRKLSMLLTPEVDGQFKLTILIGQLTGVESTVYGRRVTVRHMPDVPLYVDHKTWEKTERAYSGILQAVDADVEHKPRVVMAALIYAKREHTYQIQSVTLMLVTEQWVPLDGLHELPLVEALQRQGRAFIKPLKFDAKTAAGFPNALLLDAGALPIPLHVVSPYMDEKDRSIKEKSLKASGGAGWCWRTEQEMPPLPPSATPMRAARTPTGESAAGAGKVRRAPPPAMSGDLF